MNKVKIVFFDVDGTLIGMHRKTISEKTKEALLRLRENGILICIASGRSPVSIPKPEGVTFDAHLSYNGSFCYSGPQVIYSNPIPTADVKTVIRNCAELGKSVSIATKNRLAANGDDADLCEYYRIANLELEVSEDFDQVAEEEVYQVMMACSEPEFPAILKGTTGAKITFAWDRAADVIPATSGKGTGIRKILEYYGIDRKNAMAFGDGNNDVEMFREVGMGVAMGNASDALKAVAWDICGDVNDDGIYHYCLEKGLI